MDISHTTEQLPYLVRFSSQDDADDATAKNGKDRNHNGGVSSRTNALKRTATAATNAAAQSQPLHSSSLMLSMSSDRNHNTLNAAGVNVNHGGVHEDGNVHGSLKEDAFQINPLNNHIKKSLSDRGDDMDEEGILNSSHPPPPTNEIMSMRMGLLWLAFVTLAISILSDIIVETIDGFAARSKMTEIFTSVIIIP
jgi:Ca2+/H+ antiporter